MFCYYNASNLIFAQVFLFSHTKSPGHKDLLYTQLTILVSFSFIILCSFVALCDYFWHSNIYFYFNFSGLSGPLLVHCRPTSSIDFGTSTFGTSYPYIFLRSRLKLFIIFQCFREFVLDVLNPSFWRRMCRQKFGWPFSP